MRKGFSVFLILLLSFLSAACLHVTPNAQAEADWADDSTISARDGVIAMTGCRAFGGKAVTIQFEPLSSGLAQEQVDAHEALHRETIDSMGCREMWLFRWENLEEYKTHILYDEVKAYCFGSLPVVLKYRPQDSTNAANFFGWLIAKKGFKPSDVWHAWNERCPVKSYPGGLL